MARQITVSDEVFRKLFELKDIWKCRSISEVIRILLNKVELDVRTKINMIFDQTYHELMKFTEYLDVLEFTRIFYLYCVDSKSDTIEKAEEVAKEGLLKAIEILRKQ